MSKDIQEFGHQYKADQKALEACKDSLEQAASHICKIENNPDVDKLFNMINMCITRATLLSYSANERYEQNS